MSTVSAGGVYFAQERPHRADTFNCCSKYPGECSATFKATLAISATEKRRIDFDPVHEEILPF